MTNEQVTKRHPWAWVPTLYFAQGVPYVVVMTVSVIMYKRMGISNTDIALYTSWLYLPWVIKPLWSPLVDMFRTKRLWIVVTQFIVGAALAMVALTIPMPAFFQYTLAVFWLMAFSSATHDIAADGFYMLALEQHQQAAFVGVRSMFYRIAMITGQGLLVVVAGQIETNSGGNIAFAWSVTFGILSALFMLFFVYHKFMLPHPVVDKPTIQSQSTSPVAEFFKVFLLFFKKKNIIVTLLFLLFYRFAEAQLVKLVSPFLLDARDKGGLGLTTSEVGIVYGTVGIIALTLGGLLGGFLASRNGLKSWLWPMVFIIHLPDLAFVYLSQVQPENFVLINIAVALEQFGYGFGFTAYMLFMIMVSEGEHKTAHYAICTGFMALGMMIPGMFSGALQEAIGYQSFFLWIIASTIPGFVVAALVKVDPEFGKKRTA
ncbi:MAG: MFS transporter [Ignavibacteriae bacterium]|nr:MFS transporter [Ignavibacteriota bacterium]